MKKWIATISLSILVLFVSGCQPTPDAPTKPVVDKTLPVLTDIKFLTDVTEVGFEWKPILNERVSGYYIYRAKADQNNGKLQRIATIDDRYASHYVDTKLQPNTEYNYKFSVYSSDKKESVASKPIKVKTNPLIESVSFLKAITGLPNRVKLIWRPHPSQRVKSYIIERNEFSSPDWDTIATIDGRLNAEYIDKGLKDNRVFRYRVKVKTYDGLVSQPSKIVEAGTKPLPLAIKGLKTTQDIPKKIVLTWEPTKDKDFAYYKVYRAINPLLYYSYVAKTKEPKYEDLINDNGADYYYFVTMVDKDGLESPRQKTAVAGATLAIPSSVYVTSSSHDGRSIHISWKTKDSRAVKFNVIKEYNGKKKVFTGIKGNSFTDSDVAKGVEYTYRIVAIDKYGLASKESERVIIEIPKD
jgi:fibronectin type 3 domain-containing protein